MVPVPPAPKTAPVPATRKIQSSTSQLAAERARAEKNAEKLALKKAAVEKAAAEKAAAEKAAAEKAAAEKAAAEKAAAEKAAAERRAAALKKRLAREAARAVEAARAKSLQQQLEARAKLQAEANLAAARAQQAAENQKLSSLFSQEIHRRVYNAWDTSFAASLNCVVQIELGPTGNLIGRPVIVRSSGSAQFDQAVVRTVERAAPFVPPIGLSYGVYKEVMIKFNAEDLNHG